MNEIVTPPEHLRHLLLVCRDTLNTDEIAMGDLKRKTAFDLQQFLVAAIDYFTEDVIRSIHAESEAVLHCNDFSEEEYIEKFSDISKIERKDIEFLIERENQIRHRKGLLNTENTIDSAHKQSIFVILAEKLLSVRNNDV